MNMMIYFWIVISAFVCQSQTSITSLPNLTSFVMLDVRFNWNYPSPLDAVDWYFGDIYGVKLMRLDSAGLTTNPSYDVDHYNDSTSNIGMVMHAVTLNNSGQYTVQISASSGTSESSSAHLIVKVPSDYDLQRTTWISINDLPSEQFNDLEIPAGGVNINVTSDLYNISGQCKLATKSINGNCEGTKCTFPTIETRTSDQIILTISYVRIDRSLTRTLTASDTKSLEPWLIAVIVVVVLAACVILIVIIVLLLKKKKSTNTRQPAPMNYAIYR